jgi:hypothetical protein
VDDFDIPDLASTPTPVQPEYSSSASATGAEHFVQLTTVPKHPSDIKGDEV